MQSKKSLLKILTKRSDARSWKEALKELGSYLFEEKIIKKEYINSIIKREKKFPTGLELPYDVNIAVPHGDIRFVKKSAVLISILSSPIKFRKMDAPEKKIDVHLIFVIALNNPKGYIKFLSKITKFFRTKKFSETVSHEKYNELILELKFKKIFS